MKALSHNIKQFNQFEEEWEAKAVELVQEALYQKFHQNPHLAQLLVATGNKKLIEANGQGDFWGSTLTVDDESTLTVTYFDGQNTLGELLMMIRDRLNN